jgi:hypothetical protein
MTEKIISTLYRYKTIGSHPYDAFFVPGESTDDLIGGLATEIINGEVVYHIYDVDETVFNHPFVTWWDKQVFENDAVVVKLPTDKASRINWKSRNRGGGVRHKNFDKAATKPYKPYTETPKKKPQSTAKKVDEPPMGIINIIKKEELE